MHAASGDPLDAIRAKMQQDPNYDPLKDPQAMQVYHYSTYHQKYLFFVIIFTFIRVMLLALTQVLEQQVPTELKEVNNLIV